MGIGWAMSGTGDDATVRRLALAAAADDRRHMPVYYVEAMLQVGGTLARHVAAGMLPKVSPHLQQSILWELNGLSLGNALDAAVDTGLMRTRPSAFEIGRQRSGAYRSRLDAHVFGMLLIYYSRFVFFDGETSTIPSEHPDLIWRFANALHDLLPISAPSQSCQESASEGRKPTCTVRFIANERVYEFEVNVESDWYDVPPVRAALDRALEDAGRDERLVPLDTGDQNSKFQVWPRAAVEVARSLSFPLADERREWRALIGDAKWREPWPIETPPPAVIALDALVIPPEPGAPSLIARLEEAAARAGWAAAYAPSSPDSLQLARESDRLDVRVTPGAAWTRVTLEPAAAALSSGAFADGIRLVCEALPVSFARTCRTDGWARSSRERCRGDPRRSTGSSSSRRLWAM